MVDFFDVEIIRSDRRSVSLIVREGRVVVRAPFRMSDKLVKEFVAKHRDWIERNIQKSKENSDKFATLSDEDVKKLRDNARVFLTEKTKYFANIMGVKYGRITITGARTRFGSCNSKGDISYSYRVMLYPESAIEYVVVHELAHILEMNHSKRFYAIVERILPDYKERRWLLK